MPTVRRISAAVAVIAAAALALSGCQLLPNTGGGTPEGPEGLEKFYSQELTWTDEGDLLDSTAVEVPLDWAEPDGETIEIAIMRHKAAGESAESLLMNPGGPGGSGYDYVRDYAEYLVTPAVLEAFDLIGFDPRGVNHSNAVVCYTDAADRDEYLYGTYDSAYGTQGWVDELTEREKAYAAACEENTGPLLAHIDAGSVARDMDVIRAVLGDDKINYLGYSYGTYLGTMYAELFPEKVGKMVLDGAVDPSVSDLDALAFQMGGFESALRAFVVDCQASNPDCPFPGDENAAMTQIRAMLDGIDAQKLVAADGRQLDSATVGTGIADYLYSDSLWPDLAVVFADLFAGQADSTFAAADDYNGRNPDGTYADNGNDVYSAVTCAEGDLGTDSVDTLGGIPVLQEKAPTIGDYFGYDDTFVLDALCSNWPYPSRTSRRRMTPKAPPDPRDRHQQRPGDPVRERGVAVQAALQRRADQLRGRGSHDLRAGASACVNDTVDAYFIDGTVPASDPMC